MVFASGLQCPAEFVQWVSRLRHLKFVLANAAGAQRDPPSASPIALLPAVPMI